MRVIAGEAHGRRIDAPRGLNTRPATARVRTSIFSRLSARFDMSGARVLDLFAGSGSLGLEALSRGAASATFVDTARTATNSILKNLRTFGFQTRGRIVAKNVMTALAGLGAAHERFELVFIDAPYANDITGEVLAALVQFDLNAPRGWAVARQAEDAVVPATPDGLECISEATVGDHRIMLYRRLEKSPA
ncbi:MAG TPA: 16S rRNA (guanine(966)-N(2))-methyltransferase RsmD [Candidatus Binataceae bacterium]|nr:16S rRNA (guanine(966)-N(2))-methyltransferase RsmD [Candidatus Binataceae bacterium]